MVINVIIPAAQVNHEFFSKHKDAPKLAAALLLREYTEGWVAANFPGFTINAYNDSPEGLRLTLETVLTTDN